ncbi:MAG: ABC transporter ATP-binding protein/permease [Rhizobiales bacterium]|nr:ABC transporter ATP-binding protein/permease [Hyphomicrobiales bacterium]
MLPIATASALAGALLGAAWLAGAMALSPAISALSLGAAAIAYQARAASHLIRAIIGFLIALHLTSVVVLAIAEIIPLSGPWRAYCPTPASAAWPVVFAGLVFAASFVPVIGQITRLADPFFAATDKTSIAFPGGLRLAVTERTIAHALLFGLMAINIAQVFLTVLLNQWNGRFFTALQQRDGSIFWAELRIWAIIAALIVVARVYEIYLVQYAQMRWRRWATAHLTRRWLEAGIHGLRLQSAMPDNPDQRIAEDIGLFATATLEFWSRLFTAGISLQAFVIILWTLSAQSRLPIAGFRIDAIPGYLVWAALAFAVVGTLLAHLIGRPLIRVGFDRQRHEANFRFGLMRIREHDEQIASLKGATAERANLNRGFLPVVANWAAYMRHTRRLTFATSTLGQIALVFPIIVLAPAYFSGAVQLGGLTQTMGAFFRVQDALSLFTEFYRPLADYKAVIDRLTGFEQAMTAAPRPSPPTITRSAAGDAIVIDHVVLARPDGTPMTAVPPVTIRPGDRVLVTGLSGSGKSTLLRALAGVWPHGSGAITVPARASMMLLTAEPYLPIGSLREAIAYPAPGHAHDDATLAAALRDAGLPAFAERLDQQETWHSILSAGEQQRLAVARALVTRPDWLLLDEATAGLDEAAESAIHAIIAKRLPGTAVVSAGHRSGLARFHGRSIDLTAQTHTATETQLLPGGS